MKILHTADLHIGAELSYLGERASSRRYEVLGVFRNITTLCKNENVEICLIAGDLFDSNSAAKEFFPSVMSNIAETKNTRFFYVAGNHDPLYATSPLVCEKLPDNLYVFGTEYETTELKELGVRIAGRSFSHSSMEFCDKLSMPQDELVNILLLHADFAKNESVYNPITPEFAKNCGADFIALGHIHKRTQIEKIGNTYIAYPGCPEGQGFDESGPKGVYIGDISKSSCDLRFTECSDRIHVIKKADLSAATDTSAAVDMILSALKSEFGEDFARNLYKLTLVGETERADIINFAELSAELSKNLYFVKLINNLRDRLDLKLLSQEISLKGLFVKNMLEKINNAESLNKKTLTDALYLGLRAFNSEVKFDED